jgi:glycoside/pentoside/hexuronide:cation symporter, GPH family
MAYTRVQKAAEPAVEITLKFKFIWGLAGLGLSMIAGIYAALLPIFFQDYLGLAARWIAIGSVVYAVWNAINDPLFGYITDNTRSKLGRRIPYMRYTAPFLALTFILIWFAPPQAGQQALFWWMLVSMLLYDTAYTIIGLVYSALLPEITESEKDRNELQISAALFALAGALLGFIVPDLFRPKGEAISSFYPLQIAMIVVGVTGALLIIFTSYNVKERPEYTRVDKPLPFKKALRFTLRNRAFLALVTQNFLQVLVIGLLVGAAFYVADYVLQMNAIVLLMFIFIPMAIGVPLTTFVRQRIGLVQTQQLFLGVGGVGLVSVSVVPDGWIPACMVLAGLGIAGPHTLLNVLFAQVADEDELRSGVRREGAFFGMNALITKPAQSVAFALLPFILELTNFVTRQENLGEIFLDQPESAILGIKIIAGLIPGLAMLLGALVLFLYPIKGAYLAQIEEQILKLHARKKANLENLKSR